MSTRVLTDGKKNCIIVMYRERGEDSFSFESLNYSPKKVLIQNILYSFEKNGTLCWVMDGEEKVTVPFLPLSGRGKMNFEEFHPLPPPEGCTGLKILADGAWFMMMDMEKT